MAIIDQEARPLAGDGAAGVGARLHDRDRRRDVAARAAFAARQPAVGCVGPAVDRELRDARRERGPARAANGEREVVPRVSDLDALAASTSGKIEIETLDDGREGQVLERIVKAAIARGVPGPRAAGAARPDRLVVRGRLDRAHRRGHARRPSTATCSRQLDGMPAVLADLGVGESPAGIAQRHRVRARGPAPHEAAQQGRGRHPRHLPRPRLTAGFGDRSRPRRSPIVAETLGWLSGRSRSRGGARRCRGVRGLA